jgi:hypothetical protein
LPDRRATVTDKPFSPLRYISAAIESHLGWDMPFRRPKRDLPPVDKLPLQLKEFTIQMGDADLYVNLERRLDLDNAHTLYEAVLSDQHGSRLIYVDREELAACLADSPILQGESGSASPQKEP